MTSEEYLSNMKPGYIVDAGSEEHLVMHELSQRALKITMELNNKYHTKEEIVQLMSDLTGRKIDESFGMFPPFYTDCGRNIHMGKNVFINAGCKFQDQGGIYINDGVLIGHNAVLATINHMEDPEKRAGMIFQPIHIEKNVWLGANVTVLPGVTIGEGSIIAAGAVVTKDVPANMIAAGVPAKVIRKVKKDAGKAYNGLQGWVDCFEKASLKGMVGGGGIDAANTAADHVDAMKKAYELGKGL